MDLTQEKENLISSFKQLKEQYEHFKTLVDWNPDLQEDSTTGEIIYKEMHRRLVERAQFLDIAQDEFKKEVRHYNSKLKKTK